MKAAFHILLTAILWLAATAGAAATLHHDLQVSLDAGTGRERWRYDPKVSTDHIPYSATCRGVSYYEVPDAPSDAACKRRIIEGTLDAERRNRESINQISWKQSLLNPRVIGLGFVYMGITVPLYGLSFFLPQIIKGFGGLGNVEIVNSRRTNSWLFRIY